MREPLYLGGVYPYTLSLSRLGALKMKDYDFTICYYCNPQRVVAVKKANAVKVDDDTYLVHVDTRLTGIGQLRFAVEAIIPDTDYADIKRPEIIDNIDSGADVIRSVIKAEE